MILMAFLDLLFTLMQIRRPSTMYGNLNSRVLLIMHLLASVSLDQGRVICLMLSLEESMKTRSLVEQEASRRCRLNHIGQTTQSSNGLLMDKLCCMELRSARRKEEKSPILRSWIRVVPTLAYLVICFGNSKPNGRKTCQIWIV